MADSQRTPYYSDESVTLWHGDCREVQEWLRADVLITDPPYGYNHSSGGGPRGSASWRNTQIANDADTSARDWALNSWAMSGECGKDRPALVFGSWKSERPATTRALLIWDKGGHAGMGDLSIPWKPNFEEVYVLGSGFSGHRDSGVLSGCHVPANEAAGRVHPHEKPVTLMMRLIVNTAGVIADPFAGSGTTLVAAKLAGRKAVGIEFDERYCEIAAKRLAQDVLDFGGVA